MKDLKGMIDDIVNGYIDNGWEYQEGRPLGDQFNDSLFLARQIAAKISGFDVDEIKNKIESEVLEAWIRQG